MSNSLKNKALSGVYWTTIERFSFLGIQFLVTILIARVLTPSDYGLIGMLSIFLALGNIILDSGFGQALIRKSDVDQTDYSSVFYLNLLIGILIYLILFLLSGCIADFFNSPPLENIAKAIFLVFPINSLGLIQNTILLKNLNFKTSAKISISSAIISGIISLVFAYSGFGVWTLVVQMLSQYSLRVILLWFFGKWKPSLEFSIERIKSIFIFSSNLLGTGVIIVLFNNIYTLIIGKFYPANLVGLYTQAKRFEEVPTQTITSIIQKVSFPLLSTVQNDDNRLKSGYRNIVKQAVFITFPLMLGLLATAENLFEMLLTPNWKPAVPIFQILCIIGALYPLQSINVNILKVKGNGKLLLRLEILRRFIMIISIVLTFNAGIMALLAGQLASSIISVIINMFYCGKEINFKLKEQISDISPYLLLSVLMMTIQISLSYLQTGTYTLLLLQIVLGTVIYFTLSKLFKLDAYIVLAEIIKKRMGH